MIQPAYGLEPRLADHLSQTARIATLPTAPPEHAQLIQISEVRKTNIMNQKLRIIAVTLLAVFYFFYNITFRSSNAKFKFISFIFVTFYRNASCRHTAEKFV